MEIHIPDEELRNYTGDLSNLKERVIDAEYVKINNFIEGAKWVFSEVYREPFYVCRDIINFKYQQLVKEAMERVEKQFKEGGLK